MPSRRKWRFVPGPGTTIALMIAAYVLITNRDMVQDPSEIRQPPREQAKVVLTPQQRLGPTPDIAYLLDKKAVLKLTESQQANLRVMSDEQQTELKPLLAKVRKSGEDLGGMLKGNLKPSSTPVLSAAGGEFSKLSARVFEIRNTYWLRASKILDKPQRQQAAREREADFMTAINRLGYK